MRKFNWDEFKNKYNKIAVNCKTEEEAKDFCKRMHEHGMKWCTGKSYMEKTNYEEYKGETCYVGSGVFSSYCSFSFGHCGTFGFSVFGRL